MRAIDATGVKYGRLTAIKRVQGDKTPWLWECECGNEVVVPLDRVKRGVCRSCGCLRVEATRERSIKHGHSVGRKASRTLKSYQHARERCTNPNTERWDAYGGRGITMCDRWLSGFSYFLEDMGECPPGMSIERIDNDGPYSPENCRWAPLHEQAENKQQTVWVEFHGERMCLKRFAEKIGHPYKSLHAKVRYKGMDPLSFV